jgi:hypothetical protein
MFSLIFKILFLFATPVEAKDTCVNLLFSNTIEFSFIRNEFLASVEKNSTLRPEKFEFSVGDEISLPGFEKPSARVVALLGAGSQGAAYVIRSSDGYNYLLKRVHPSRNRSEEYFKSHLEHYRTMSDWADENQIRSTRPIWFSNLKGYIVFDYFEGIPLEFLNQYKHQLKISEYMYLQNILNAQRTKILNRFIKTKPDFEYHDFNAALDIKTLEIVLFDPR